MADKMYNVLYFSSVLNIINEVEKSADNTLTDGDSLFYITKIADGRYPVFCLAKIKTRDLSKICNYRNKKEREIDLKEDEGLLDKCYFAASPRGKQFVCQVNTTVCYPTRIASIISGVLRYTDDIISPVKKEGSLAMEDTVYQMDIKGNFLPSGGNSDVPTIKGLRSIIDGLQASKEDVKFSLQISTDKNHKPLCSGGIFNKIFNNAGISLDRARVKIEDGDAKWKLVDLLEHQEKETISVEMNGLYPVESNLVQELRKCISE